MGEENGKGGAWETAWESKTGGQEALAIPRHASCLNAPSILSAATDSRVEGRKGREDGRGKW